MSDDYAIYVGGVRYVKGDRIEELEADRRKTYEALLKVTRIHDEVEAKLAQQDDLVQAAVAAALREAANIARASLDGEIAYDDILDLITTDAQAALDRALAAALREAVAAVKKDADNDDISHGAAQWVSDTILALITQSAKGESDA